MSHKLVSDKAVVYNAATLESSYLTIVPNQIQFLDNESNGLTNSENEHQVQINAAMFANYGITGSNEQVRIDGYNYTLTGQDWDTYLASQTLSSTGNYDQVLEASLKYIKDNIPTTFGLSTSNWIYSE